MKKRSIVIEFETDASEEVLEEIAENMRWQLESLNDGTLDMDGDGEYIDEPYIVTKMKMV